MRKNIFLILTFLILTFLNLPKDVSAACGDGWFCGIDQGYAAVINYPSYGCYATTSYQCTNTGVWSGSGTYECKDECYGSGENQFCVTTKSLDCTVNLYPTSSFTYTASTSPLVSYTTSKFYNSCSASGSSCILTRKAITTTCCVKNPSSTPTPAPTNPPTPSCNLSLTPATVNPLLIGNTQTLTATLSSVQNGSISNVTFETSDAGVATISSASDSSSPYNSVVTGVAPGTATITAKGIMDESSRCSDTTTITVPQYSCTVTLLPANAGTIDLGGTATFIATVTPTNGLVTRVNFLSGNTAFVTVNPASDNTVTYSTIATGVGTGSTTVRADVIMGGASRCNDISTITIAPPGPWWQVMDGDITTNGNITSAVPTASYLNIIGLGGYPGIPVYGGSLGYSPGLLSTTNWSANTSTTQGRLFDYSYFKSLIPDDVIWNDISLLSAGGAQKYDNYEWYKVSSDVNIDSDLILGSRKIILIVEGADLNINARINLVDNAGFFGTFVEGDINVNASVTRNVGPALEGIYLTSGSFNTGAGNSRFHARGSVSSFGGINLQRDLADNTSPAELFEYGPDQVLLFPSKLAFRRIKWVEVAP